MKRWGITEDEKETGRKIELETTPGVSERKGGG